jgi:hypothetical protein
VSGEDYKIQTFDVKVKEGYVYLHLPPVEVLEETLCAGTEACSATIS